MRAIHWRVLFVCTGNICRSPLAQGLMEAVARDRGLESRFTIDSVGTHAHVGEPPHPLSVTVAAVDHGVDITAQRARQFTLEDFRRFDRILALDRTHLSWLTARRPSDAMTTPELLLAGRGSSGDAEVPDPYGRPRADFEYVARLIKLGITRLVDELAG